jgi:tRNA(Ser,Leu) C12 N-acetylase TAN1
MTMKLSSGQYHGTELSEVPTEYLEWAIGHLSMDEEMEQAVVAEVARRAQEARVEAETPLDHLKERVSETITKFAAKHGL